MKEYKVAIIGVGVSGSSLLWGLNKFSSIKPDDICIIEKYNEFSKVNSNRVNNSQTLHFGDIETNSSVEKSVKQRKSGTFVKNFVRSRGSGAVYQDMSKMVIGVGTKEMKVLEERYLRLKPHFPNLTLLNEDEIARLEPKVMEGRKEPINAILGEDGVAVDFGALSALFVKECRSDVFLNEKVFKIEDKNNWFEVHLKNKTIRAKSVAVTAGTHSLLFAKQMGYGDDYSIIPIAGNFYHSKVPFLKGKVYTVQKEGLPNAAIHGDAEMGLNVTRFGPTAKIVLMLERRNYNTVEDYFKTLSISWRAFMSYWDVTSDMTRFRYMLKNNLLYEFPLVGAKFFTMDARKVVPTLGWNDLRRAKNYGGLRGQIVDHKTGKLIFGEAKIEGKGCWFNMTPSPGASDCLHNTLEDGIRITNYLGETFYEKSFLEHLG